MQQYKKSLVFFVFNCVLVTTISAQSKSDLRLWYKKPATRFEEALPVGNGRLGAMFYGGINTERLSLNEETLWSGGPVDPHMNPNAKDYLQSVRTALFSNDYRKADSLMKFMQGKYSESYAPLGNLFLHFHHANNNIVNYKRELNIQHAVGRVSYRSNGTEYIREYFASYPDQVIVIRLTAKGKDKIDVDCKFNSLLLHRRSVHKGSLVMKGHSPVHAEPNYRGNMPNAIVQDTVNAMRFVSQLRILKADGKRKWSDSAMHITDASEIVLLLSMATSYNGIHKNPGREGKR